MGTTLKVNQTIDFASMVQCMGTLVSRTWEHWLAEALNLLHLNGIHATSVLQNMAASCTLQLVPLLYACNAQC